jgi:hypothetical protein
MSKKIKSIGFICLFLGVIATIYILNNRNKHTEIEGLPSKVGEFLTQQDVDELEELDYPIHFGLNPPNIEGLYLADSQRVDYDKGGQLKINSAIADTHDYFYDQTDDLEITRESVHIKSQVKREGNVGYISGDDNCFSIFDIGVTKRKFGCITTSADIISGCLNEEGHIEDFQISIMMLNHNSKIACEIIPRALKELRPMSEGNIRIISERDKVVERVE